MGDQLLEVRHLLRGGHVYRGAVMAPEIGTPLLQIEIDRPGLAVAGHNDGQLLGPVDTRAGGRLRQSLFQRFQCVQMVMDPAVAAVVNLVEPAQEEEPLGCQVGSF